MEGGREGGRGGGRGDVLQTELLDALDYEDLEFIGDVVHVGGDLKREGGRGGGGGDTRPKTD